MKFWIARDRYGLCLYTENPYLMEEENMYTCDEQIIPLDDNFFPEVTFENSPQQVELKLLEK